MRPELTMLLTDASIENLVDELMRRCPAFVLAICEPDDAQTVQTNVYMHGGIATILGLSEMTKDASHDRLRLRKSEPDEPEKDSDSE